MIIKKEFDKHPIEFLVNDKELFINATATAKVFNKQPKDYFKNKNTLEYCSTLAKYLKINEKDIYPNARNAREFSKRFPELIEVKYGKKHSTWIHKELLIDFSRWLDPAFSVWCDQIVKGFIRHKYVKDIALLERNVQDLQESLFSVTRLSEDAVQQELVRLFSFNHPLKQEVLVKNPYTKTEKRYDLLYITSRKQVCYELKLNKINRKDVIDKIYADYFVLLQNKYNNCYLYFTSYKGITPDAERLFKSLDHRIKYVPLNQICTEQWKKITKRYNWPEYTNKIRDKFVYLKPFLNVS